jgi:alginate O-acetyltransferase complex protein AlgI
MGGATHATRGVICITVGAACMLAARLVWTETGSLWATAPLIMIGFSLILHYGLFALVIAGWRKAGCNARPLFRNPLASRSLADFWGHRWNLAYVEMCQETVVRVFKTASRENAKARVSANEPIALSRVRGQQVAVFLFSGLLHECAISLPVNAGYGLPTLYFVLNGGAMLVGRKLRDGTIAARAWAAFWVIAPLPLLFHPWFIVGIVLPMVGINP